MSGASPEDVWFADGLHFECQPDCANCCRGEPGDVWITDEEKNGLASCLALPLDEFNRLYVRRMADGDSLRERKDGDCVLLRENASGCTAYDARPRQCRTFPFWNENLTDREAWEWLKNECPGIDKGRLWPREEIDRIRH